jgi:iron complex transport system substrate-binding protein
MIDRYGHYQVLKVWNRSAAGLDTLVYLLVDRGYPAPAGYSGASVIEVPISSLAVMSSMHAAEAKFAGIEDRIVGLGSIDFISSPGVRQRIREGKVKQIGLDGNLNNELIVTMHPGILVAMANPDASTARYSTLIRAGIPVLMDNEWLESNPLGRAEWVKVMAALAGREGPVDQKFDSVAAAYEEMARIGRRASQKPHVIIGMPFKGSWFMPAGGSYMGCLLQDAGATYKWSDTRGTGSLSLDFESVAPEALIAEYWLDIGEVRSKKEIADRDLRYLSFQSVRNGNLYNNNKRTNDLGANDYWESGGVSPDLILADMIRILHPDLLPAHELYYYKQLR